VLSWQSFQQRLMKQRAGLRSRLTPVVCASLPWLLSDWQECELAARGKKVRRNTENRNLKPAERGIASRQLELYSAASPAAVLHPISDFTSFGGSRCPNRNASPHSTSTCWFQGSNRRRYERCGFAGASRSLKMSELLLSELVRSGNQWRRFVEASVTNTWPGVPTMVNVNWFETKP